MKNLGLAIRESLATNDGGIFRRVFPGTLLKPPIIIRGPISSGPILPGSSAGPVAGGACSSASAVAPGWICVNGQWQVASDVNPIGPLPIILPTPVPMSTSPVPAGYPTSQIFVNSDGSFWQWSPSQNAWVNVGTPYGTGASATPGAPPPSSSGASTAVPSTVAPAPSTASSTPVLNTGYQAILDWLEQDSLGSSIGFAGIPNWIVTAGVGLLAYKLTRSGGRK